MAWSTDEAGSIAGVRAFVPPRRPSRPFNFTDSTAAFRGRHYVEARGLHRVFNDFEYRLFRSNVAPPLETDTPFATTATLPFEPSDLYADGTWFLSMTFFNGVHESGFLPLGPAGETYLRLDIAAATEELSPPNGPLENAWYLKLLPGQVQVVASYRQDDALRADEWVLNWTTGAGLPAEDVVRASQPMRGSGVEVLKFDGVVGLDGVQVNYRLQTRRNDGTPSVPIWVLSDGAASVVKTVFIDADPPAPPLAGGYVSGAAGG